MKQFSWVRDTWGRIRPGAVAAPANFSLNPEMTRYALSFILLPLPEALSSGWTLEIILRGCSVMPQRIRVLGQPAGMCCSEHWDECDGQISGQKEFCTGQTSKNPGGFFPVFPWIICWLIWGYLISSVCYKCRSCEGWWYLSLSCAPYIARNC